jgi:hypothetical protein
MQRCAKRLAASSAIQVIGKEFERKSQLKMTTYEGTTEANQKVVREEE